MNERRQRAQTSRRARPPRALPRTSGRGGTAAAAAHGRVVRARRRRLVLIPLALTWIPGLLGAAFGVSFLRSWGALGGYAGLTWLLPGCATGLIVDRVARPHLAAHRLLGLAAGLATAGSFLLAAASVIGP